MASSEKNAHLFQSPVSGEISHALLLQISILLWQQRCCLFYITAHIVCVQGSILLSLKNMYL